ncbi:hypothetical protein KFE98_05370 [bacterium SCSIO 12741]|nr:hypothetical protein KFE98_05370 [bacterium SCSIO 12741]
MKTNHLTIKKWVLAVAVVAMGWTVTSCGSSGTEGSDVAPGEMESTTPMTPESQDGMVQSAAPDAGVDLPWEPLGDDADAGMIAATSATVYRLNRAEGNRVEAWVDGDNVWEVVGNPANAIYAAGDNLYAIGTDQSLWYYKGSPQQWEPRGAGPAKAVYGFANDYYISTDNESFMWLPDPDNRWEPMWPNTKFILETDMTFMVGTDGQGHVMDGATDGTMGGGLEMLAGTAEATWGLFSGGMVQYYTGTAPDWGDHWGNAGSKTMSMIAGTESRRLLGINSETMEVEILENATQTWVSTGPQLGEKIYAARNVVYVLDNGTVSRVTVE